MEEGWRLDFASMPTTEPSSEAEDARESLSGRGPYELGPAVGKSAPASETEHQLGCYESPGCAWL